MDTIPAGSRLTLNLGVAVVPYRSASGSGKKRVTSLTTGDVAQFIEDKYALLATFYRIHQRDIAKDLENSLAGAMESLLMHRAVDPWGAATQSIQQRMKDFVLSSEAERVGIPGTPTMAALMGHSQRYKHPYAKHPRRPSFRDSGLMVGSYRSWISS
jgi:hypothetical protein